MNTQLLFPKLLFPLGEREGDTLAHMVSCEPMVPCGAAGLWDGSCCTQWGR